MSNTSTGAASAAPGLVALAEQIRTEIAAAEDGHRTALQHAIRAGELLTEAKARLAHGEWLPWLEKNFNLSRQTADNYRALAANCQRVSNLNSVREALAAIKQPKAKNKPKRREHKENRAKIHDPAVITWVAKCDRAGMGREDIMQASEQDTHDWPRPGEKLTRVNVDEVRAIAEHERIIREQLKRTPPKESGKRLRQLHAEKRAGRTGDLWHLQKATAEAVGVLEGFDLPELDWSEETEALVMDIFEDLERHARWNNAALDAVTAHMGELGRQRKIKMLRVRADDPSSPQSERATAALLAERLERRRSAARLSS